MRRLRPALIALALAAAGVVALRSGLPGAAIDADPGTSGAAGAARAAGVAGAAPAGHGEASAPADELAAPAIDPGPRPRSLRGTRVDGELTADASGRLVVTPATRRFFDYFLAATGEEPDDAIRARIVAAIARRLPPAAAREAEALLDRYLRYRERARELAESGAAGDLAMRVAAVSALRREVFGPEDAAALFAAEEAEVEAALVERRIVEDPALTDEERIARLAEMRATEPAAVREARAAATLATALRDREAVLAARGGSPAELRALREELVGAEAADRLEALDRSRAEWRRRVADYRAERAAIEADPALGADARAAAIEDLLSRRFAGPERVRVQALDEIAVAEGSAAPRAADVP